MTYFSLYCAFLSLNQESDWKGVCVWWGAGRGERGWSWAQNGHVLMEGRLLRREGTNLCPAQSSRKLG